MPGKPPNPEELILSKSPNESSDDKSGMRQAELGAAYERTHPAEVGAISLRMAGVANPQDPDLAPEAENGSETANQTYELSDLTPEKLRTLKPGDKIHVGDQSELKKFEDKIALALHPGQESFDDRSKWKKKERLEEQAKPTKFKGNKYNGKIGGIFLTVMSDPSGELVTAMEDTSKISPFIKKERIPKNAPDNVLRAVRDATIGFDVISTTKSRGYGAYGTVQSKIWYTAAKTGETNDIWRSMTKPKVTDTTTVNPGEQTQEP